MTKKIIIVEDDETLGQVMQQALQKRGYDVVSVTTLITAREALAQTMNANGSPHRKFDLAIVDLKLANESSLDFLPELREHNPQIKTVMLTGYASIATAVEAVKLGATNYLPKPATISEILIALEELPTVADKAEEVPEDALVSLSVRRLEWEHIQRVLQKNNGNISATARELNMHRRTLQRKLQKKPVRE